MDGSTQALYRTKNTLAEETRAQAVGLLNRHLASAIDLKAQAKQAHWNVKGPNFIALHELFDKVAGAAVKFIHLLAEPAPPLGGTAAGAERFPAPRPFLPPCP